MLVTGQVRSVTATDEASSAVDFSTVLWTELCADAQESLVDVRIRAPAHCRARLLMRAVSSVTWVYVARRSLIRLVIFLTACMTVVWSLPPKARPISHRDECVIWRAWHTATYRGKAVAGR